MTSSAARSRRASEVALVEQNCFNVRGRVADVQRYSIHDGPGIRTIVFLKGCHFRCRWCCNPEMQEYAIETMVVNGVPKTVGRDMSVAEVMQEVVKDRDYYRNSGGGMTLSGGECLSQPEFAIALLQAAKEEGLDTAIETTGFASYEEVIARVLPNLDTCLMDIKHMDAAKHKAFTGQSNALCLENAAKIAANAKADYPGAHYTGIQRYAGGNRSDCPVRGIASRCGAVTSASVSSVGAG